MSEIGVISTGVAATQAMTQLNISTEALKKVIEADQKMAKALEGLSVATSPATKTASGGVDIYV
jgi:hypothetical protein